MRQSTPIILLIAFMAGWTTVELKRYHDIGVAQKNFNYCVQMAREFIAKNDRESTIAWFVQMQVYDREMSGKWYYPATNNLTKP